MTKPCRPELKLLFLTLIVLLSLTFSLPAGAQGGIQATLNEYEYAFRDHITFRVEASSEAEIAEITLFVRVSGESGRQRDKPDFEPSRSISAEIVWDKMAEDQYRPPGVTIKYWWQLKDVAGNELKTEPVTFVYMDDKHPWQVLENEDLALYWYEGGDSLGSTLIERAVQALEQISSELGVKVEDQLKSAIHTPLKKTV